MLQLVYVSSATELFSYSELVDLLAKSREKNARLGITGMLLYRDGNFVQVLEGEPAAVDSLYATIARDPRHTGAIVLLRQEKAAREFPEWSMGFRDLNSPEVRSLPGYSEFMNVKLTPDLGSGRAKRLLQLFKEKM